MKLSESYRKGNAIRDKAISLVSVNPFLEMIMKSFPVEALPMKKMNQLEPRGPEWSEDIPYDTYGYTAPRLGNKPYVAVADVKYPTVPNLALGNVKHLRPYATEKDLITHEIGHAIDYIRGEGSSSEPSAISFSDFVSGGSQRTPNTVSLGNARLAGYLNGGGLRDHKFFISGKEFV